MSDAARDLQGLPLGFAVAALNHVLEQQGWARERLVRHQGRSIRVGIDPSFPLAFLTPNLHLVIGEGGLLARDGAGRQGVEPKGVEPEGAELKRTEVRRADREATGREGAESEGAESEGTERAGADVSLWFTPSPGAILAGLREGADGLAGHLRIEGDVGLAAVLGDLARQLRWDVEEDLSRVVGDAAAHRMVRGAQGARQRFEQDGGRAVDSIRQWLTHEDPVLVEASAFSAHREELAALRRRIEALEARTSR